MQPLVKTYSIRVKTTMDFSFDATARLSEAELTRQTIAASQRMRDLQRQTCQESDESVREARAATAMALAKDLRRDGATDAQATALTDATDAVTNVVTDAVTAVTVSQEEEFERPDWTQHFAGVPLNVMEEAARKSMARGSRQPPAWEDWRNDLREAGKEMAAHWGQRDKCTRVVDSAGFVDSAQPGTTATEPSVGKAPRFLRNKQGAWNQDEDN